MAMEHGYHLIIDGFTTAPHLLADGQAIDRILRIIVQKIGMKLIDGPFITKYDAQDEADSGITGVAILAESHIAVHTWPNKGYFAIDIFSCKPFDVERTNSYLRSEFGMGLHMQQFVSRGISKIVEHYTASYRDYVA